MEPNKNRHIYKYSIKREKILEVREDVLTSSPEQVYEFLMMIKLHEVEQEHLLAIVVDPKNKIKGYYSVCIGLLDMCVCHQRELFRKAILQNASGIIMAHNHTSNAVEPSADDIRITSQMKDASKIIGIRLVDHIIVGENNYFSFMQKNIL
ncbi:MAG: JAB domain-containing protein [Victivallales bacterium]